MLKKLIMGAIALFFIFVGAMIILIGYTVYNPDSIFTAFNKVSQHFTRGEDYQEQEEYFLQGIKNINIKSNRMPIHVRTYNGSTLKVSLEGKAPRFEKGPYLSQLSDQSSINIVLNEPMSTHWIHLSVNGEEYTEESDAKLVAAVYLPEKYAATLNLHSETGDIEFVVDKNQIFEFELKSELGKIDNHAQMNPAAATSADQVAKIHIQTTSGNITVTN
ncbi:DUF4097 domain-containing protein [Bdellovibrio sp. SKB1291214]|uniref:DUF4097 family beta strand repeat-containing protein n=1 Tax=Bdellovibrio sp. SKB1291214 TaxID=1732569 RepID=UPI000B5157C0|nr:DUF4097 family beta strand repeat-containing protein [Bdellovibrio sp. SKB1291214]UYL09179.1 DUF4097 domain-containing protein [Bdellovibrio sp. SKB1291214]